MPELGGNRKAAASVGGGVRRLVTAAVLAGVVMTGACTGSDGPAARDETSSTTSTSTLIQKGPPSAAEELEGAGPDCVSTPETGSLKDRDFAFDGTVVSIEQAIDPKYPEPDVLIPRATFEVNEWFTGGSDETVQVWMQREVTPGERLLVTGAPRWGGDPLDDAIAWECGWTQPYTEVAATGWARTFED